MPSPSIESELLQSTPRKIRRRTREHPAKLLARGLFAALIPVMLFLIWESSSKLVANYFGKTATSRTPLDDLGYFIATWTILATFIIFSRFIFYWLPERERRLIKFGVPVVARVTEQTTYSSEEVIGNVVVYEFTPEPGLTGGHKMVTGKKTLLSREVPEWQAGDHITILYDPRRPDWNLIYALSNYQAEL